MKFKVKPLGIATGGILVVVLNAKDARKGSFHTGDRVHFSVGKKAYTAAVDITHNDKLVPIGSVGFFEEMSAKINVKSIELSLAGKPASLEYIKKKVHGHRLTKEQMFAIIQDVANDKLTDIEKTFFVSACYHNELSESEILGFIDAFVHTGEVFDSGKSVVLDKHCIGGVAGNRTTAIVVPIIAAAGYTIPKTSSRSITSPAGTSDAMEVLCKVTLSVKEMQKVVKKTNGCLVWGGAMNLAPADDKLIKIEHPLSLDPIGQLIASVLAKKKSVGATHVLIDIPVGKGAKIDSMAHARMLKRKFLAMAKPLGMKIYVAITDGAEPIGNGIGPALEARDMLWTLQGHEKKCPMLRSKAIVLAGKLLEMVGEKNGQQKAKELLDSGKAYTSFQDIIKAQGAFCTEVKDIPLGRHVIKVKASKSGKVRHIDNKSISEVARIAGAPKDKGAGVYFFAHKGDVVKKDDVLFDIYAESKTKLNQAKEFAQENTAFFIR